VRAEGLAALPALETLELTEPNVETVLDEARTLARLTPLARACTHSHSAAHARTPHRTARQVRPYLMADGGNVELVEIDGLVVKLKLNGACGSCPSSTMTLKMGIQRRLMERIPEIMDVEQVMDTETGLALTDENVEKVLDEIRPYLTGASRTRRPQSARVCCVLRLPHFTPATADALRLRDGQCRHGRRHAGAGQD
jgi:Fe-S cluster biogenesis protein NfuA